MFNVMKSPSTGLDNEILNSMHGYHQEEKLRGRPGYEHLNEPLHILIEADLPANIIDIRLRQAQEIIEELLKPVVIFTSYLLVFELFFPTSEV